MTVCIHSHRQICLSLLPPSHTCTHIRLHARTGRQTHRHMHVKTPIQTQHIPVFLSDDRQRHMQQQKKERGKKKFMIVLFFTSNLRTLQSTCIYAWQHLRSCKIVCAYNFLKVKDKINVRHLRCNLYDYSTQLCPMNSLVLLNWFTISKLHTWRRG